MSGMFADEMVEGAPSSELGFFGPTVTTDQREYTTRQDRLVEHLFKFPPAAVAGAIQTFGESVYLFNQNSVDTFLDSHMRWLGDYYSRNKQPAQAVGDITGLLIPATAASKALRTIQGMEKVSDLVQNNRLARSIIGKAGETDEVLALLRARDKYLASRGSFSVLDQDTIRKQLGRRAKLAGSGDIIRDTIAAELGIYATMNASDTLYPEDFTAMDHLVLGSLFPGVFAVAKTAQINKAIRNSAQSVARDAVLARNPADLPFDKIISQPGNRDLGLTVFAEGRKEAARQRDLAPSDAPDIRSNFDTDEKVFASRMKEQVELMGKDTVVKDWTKRTNLSQEQVKTVMDAEAEFPTTMLGAYSIQNIPESVDGFIGSGKKLADARRNRIKGLREQAIKEERDITLEEADQIDKWRKEAELIETTEPYILAADGAMIPASKYKEIFQDAPEKIKTIPRIEGKEARKWQWGNIGFDEEGVFATIGKEGSTPKRLQDLSLREHTAAWSLVNKAIDNYKPGQSQIALSENSNYLTLDYVLGLHDKYGQAVMKDIRVPQGWTGGVQDIEFHSLNQKFKEFKRLRTFINNQTRHGLKLSKDQLITNYDIARRLNLPLDPFGKMHPIMELFESLMPVEDDLIKAFGETSHLRRALQEEAFWPHQVKYTDPDATSLRGQMHSWPKDKASSLVLKRPVNPLVGTGQTVQKGIEQQRLMLMNGMMNADKYGAGLVKIVFDELTTGTAAGAAKIAMDVTSLATGTTRTSQLSNIGLTKAMIAAENPTLQAVQSVEILTDKAVRQQVGQLFERHNQTFSNLRSDKAAIDEFNLYTHMRRQGWDLEADEVIDEASGKVMFQLSDTTENRARFQRVFGREMEEGELAPTIGPNYVPLALNEKAFQAARAVDDLDATYLANTNHLRRLEGLGPINRKAWHVPPKNLAREEVFYLIDNKSGRLHSVAHGRTIAEAKARADAEVKAAQENGMNIIVQSQQDMGRYFHLRDEAFGAMVDFTDALRQTGRPKGTSVGLTVDVGPQVLDDIVQTQSAHFESILRRTRALYFQPQLDYMKQMVSRSVPSEAAKRGETPWQMYAASIMGNPGINPNDIAGKSYFAIESVMDNMLNAAWDRLREKGGMQLPKAVRDPDAAYNRLKDSLGEFNPFQSAVDYAEKTFRVSHPPSLKKSFAKLNQFTSLLTLRLFETSHSLLTLMSLGATMPAVISGMKRQLGETPQQQAARIGSFARVVGKDSAMFNPSRALSDTFHFMFTDEGRRIYKEASEAGFMDQTVAEIFKTISAPQQNYHSELFNKMARISTFLSDESERLARGISFMTGYRIATKGLGIKDKKAAFALGHRFADETIGNYHPNNRPKMFQGAVGMPLGLFMTFMQNYYQRLFGYIEAKDARSAVIQFATQASVFGADTTPGFQQFADFFASNYDGSTNIVDGMYNKFGDDVTDAFMYGGLLNIPFMAGFGDGFGIYQRGDVTVRNIPSVFTLSGTPIATMFRDAFSAIGETVDAARAGGLTDQRAAEILGAYSTNRFLRNLGTMYAGVSVDRRGRVISEDVRSDLGMVSRMIGLRPLSEATESEAYYRQRATEMSRSAGMERLRDSIRSRARDRSLNAETLNDAVAQYAKYGGNPQYFGRFLRNQIIEGTVDREQNKVIDLLKSSSRANDGLRLMEAVGGS